MLTYLFSNNNAFFVYAHEQESAVIDHALTHLQKQIDIDVSLFPLDKSGKPIRSNSIVELENQLNAANKSRQKTDLQRLIQSYEVYAKILSRGSWQHSLSDVPLVKDYTHKLPPSTLRPRAGGGAGGVAAPVLDWNLQPIAQPQPRPQAQPAVILPPMEVILEGPPVQEEELPALDAADAPF